MASIKPEQPKPEQPKPNPEHRTLYVRKTMKTEAVICPLCSQPVKRTVAIKCGHVFCRECIFKHRRVKEICPVCPSKIRFLEKSCCIKVGEMNYITENIRDNLFVLVKSLFSRPRGQMIDYCCGKNLDITEISFIETDAPEEYKVAACHLKVSCIRDALYMIPVSQKLKQVTMLSCYGDSCLTSPTRDNVIDEDIELVLQDVEDWIEEVERRKKEKPLTK